MVEPEQKRTIIGNTFVEVFDREAKRLGIEDHLLGQGTIYPDTIETGGTKRADTIKTHHNRVPIDRADDRTTAGSSNRSRTCTRSRCVSSARNSASPHDLVWRHPFPGPGLGVRLLCSTGEAHSDGLADIEPTLAEVAGRFGLAALVMPDPVGRREGRPAFVRTPRPAQRRGAMGDAAGMAASLFKDVPGINRCIWNLGPGPPRDVTPLAATVTRERLDLLREADHLVMEGLRRHGLYDSIWQCPTVLVPLDGRWPRARVRHRAARSTPSAR